MTDDRVLGGRYELRDVLGRGGMAVVHLARDIWLERRVAVKVLHGELARDPLFRARFRREAQAVAGLDHPGIVAVHDVGRAHVAGNPDVRAEIGPALDSVLVTALAKDRGERFQSARSFRLALASAAPPDERSDMRSIESHVSHLQELRP